MDYSFYLCGDLVAKIQRMFQLFLITLAIIAAAFLLLGIKVLVGKKFVHTHIDGNRYLNKKGIHCVQSMDRKLRKENPNRVSEHSK